MQCHQSSIFILVATKYLDMCCAPGLIISKKNFLGQVLKSKMWIK